MPLLAGVLWCETAAPRSRLVTLALVALGLSWLGDSAPRLTSGDAAFLVMVGFFLLAQVAYIAAFWPYRDRSVLHVHRARLVGYLLRGRRAHRGLRRRSCRCCCSCSSTARACRPDGRAPTGVNRLTAVGGAVFLVSDGLIALDAFVPGLRPARPGVLGDGHLRRGPGAHRLRACCVEDTAAPTARTTPDAVRAR